MQIDNEMQEAPTVVRDMSRASRGCLTGLLLLFTVDENFERSHQ